MLNDDYGFKNKYSIVMLSWGSTNDADEESVPPIYWAYFIDDVGNFMVDDTGNNIIFD